VVIPSPVQHPRYASDKAIRGRMAAVGNIKKITKAMKMVASAKLRRCEDALKATRSFSAGILDLWGKEEKVLGIDGKEVTPSYAQFTATAASPTAGSTAETSTEGGKQIIPNSVLVLPITPDRGLCGSVSAQVNRAAKHRLNTLHQQNKPVMCVVMGEKARASLERNFFRDFQVTIGEHSKMKRRTFKQTSMLADHILKQPFESGEVVYNEFKNMLSFDSKLVRLPSFAQATADVNKFYPYEMEGNADTLSNLYEFSTAVRLHRYLAESDMVEFSQRVSSMGNSSKSAEEMLARLKLLYNRTRQARITTELVEIISGAAAAEADKEDGE